MAAITAGIVLILQAWTSYRLAELKAQADYSLVKLDQVHTFTNGHYNDQRTLIETQARELLILKAAVADLKAQLDKK